MKNTEKQLGDLIAKEIVSLLENIFKPVGGITGFIELISSYQATNEEKRVHRPIRYPLIMPTLFSGSNHK